MAAVGQGAQGAQIAQPQRLGIVGAGKGLLQLGLEINLVDIVGLGERLVPEPAVGSEEAAAVHPHEEHGQEHDAQQYPHKDRYPDNGLYQILKKIGHGLEEFLEDGNGRPTTILRLFHGLFLGHAQSALIDILLAECLSQGVVHHNLTEELLHGPGG